MAHAMQSDSDDTSLFRRALGVFGYTSRAIGLVWTTSRPLTFALAALTLVAGVLPAAIAWVGKLIVDGVVAAIAQDAGRPRTRDAAGAGGAGSGASSLRHCPRCTARHLGLSVAACAPCSASASTS